MSLKQTHENLPIPPRGQDKHYIQAALGGLGLCVAGLYMAVALPHFAPFAGPESWDARFMDHALTTASGPAGDRARDSAYIEDRDEDGLDKPGLVMTVGSTKKLSDLFANMGYHLDTVREEQTLVPRVYLASLPRDLDDVPSLDARKAVFIRTMLPLVLKVNESILLERGRLLALRTRINLGKPIPPEDRAWLQELSTRYGLAEPDFGLLLRRVDIIPPSVAIAQAAEESGWGTSRFAREGNAPFGQYTFDDDNGMVPAHREDGKRHMIRAYDRLLDGVRSYAQNLNSHDAYRQFRIQRAEMRARGRELDGVSLVPALLAYSERGQAYVDTIQTIIRANDLAPFDRARLKGGKLSSFLVARN
ncbi:MAG: glucosaminidase domain-containing protein [Alphaproteobacteria bacterium]